MMDFPQFQTCNTFVQIRQAEMSILVNYCKSFWQENSNVVEISPKKKKLILKQFHL